MDKVNRNSYEKTQPSQLKDWLRVIPGLAFGASGGFLYGHEASVGNISSQDFLAAHLSASVFLTMGAVAVALISLVFPRILADAVYASKSGGDFEVTKQFVSKFRHLVRAHQRLMICLIFCVVGAGVSFGFDPFMTFPTHGHQEASLQAHVHALSSEILSFDGVVEGGIGAILGTALSFLWLGLSTLISSTNTYLTDAENKFRERLGY